MKDKKKAKPTSFGDYLRQIADESQPLSIASLYRLSDITLENIELLEIAWPSVPFQRRREIVSHLVEMTEASFEVDCTAIFWIGLTDSDPEVRAAAIDGLWVTEDVKQIIPLLKMMLHDPVAEVRATAAGSLARFVLLSELDKIPTHHQIALKDTLSALRAVITNPNEDIQVRRRAVEAIAYSSADDVPGIIHAAYNSPDEKMRASALCGMGRSADDRWKDIIIKSLESPNPEMRYEAARAAGELELRPAVSRLAELVDDPDREVQEVTIWALGQIGGKRASKLLQKCYEQGDEELSEAAGEALEEMSMMRGVDLPLFAFDPNEDESSLDLED